jgi:aminoglycoside phosphotransferase (APT) family kinase protein
MHDGEVSTGAGLVRRLVAAQFPDLAGLPVSAVRSTGTVNAIYRLGDHLCDAATAAWECALQAPAWEGTAVWIHADLLRPNLLVDGGRLCAVIDFGAAGADDPAADVIAAWSVFGPAGREAFRTALGVDDGTWNRARGFALHQAALIIPYYPETNPGFVALAKRTMEQVLADVSA